MEEKPTRLSPTALERPEQLACLVELAERLASASDLDGILEAVVAAVTRGLAPLACALSLCDEEAGTLTVALTRGLDEAAIGWWHRVGHQIGWPLAAPRRLSFEPLGPAGGRGWLLRLPLALPGQPAVGTLDLFAASETALAGYDRPLLDRITGQAAAAINATRARLREVLAVYSVAQSITGRIELSELARSVLGAVVQLFGVIGGAIVLIDARAASATSPAPVAIIGPPPTAGQIERLLGLSAGRSTPFVLMAAAEPTPGIGLEPGIGLAAPLWLERLLFGVLVLTGGEERRFRQHDLWLLAAVASQVTMALRNAQLYLWSEELAIAEERSRIAREIHDGLAQSLAHKILKLELCQRLVGRDNERLHRELASIKDSIRLDIQDVRHSILALRPLDLEQRGLSEAIGAYTAQFSHDTGMRIEQRLEPLDGITPKMQTALFRLVQEALNNIRKHAQATAASLIIELVDDETIRIGIVDNGCGFDVEAALRRPPGQSGIGLRGMIERTVNAGGTIDVASQPGQGTRITILLPRG